MVETITCQTCGELLPESANTSGEQREPCPKCGTKARDLAVSGSSSLNLSQRLGTAVDQGLLTIANWLISEGHYRIAIVTSHMACEVAAERAFRAEYAAKGLIPLGNAVESLMNGHNLANDKHRKLYSALTGINLEKQKFWSSFTEASKKRNRIVHKAERAGKKEAERAWQAALELVTYLAKR